jgi:hypothetical protein
VANRTDGELTEAPTCGQGLAANATLPAKLGELMASVARVLETHTKALDLNDEAAGQESSSSSSTAASRWIWRH